MKYCVEGLRALGSAALLVLFAAPAGATSVFVNNGLAPPNPTNVVSPGETTSGDDVWSRNVGCDAATEFYGKVFKPTVHREVYSFADLPRAMEEMHQNKMTGIPVVRVAEDMPDAVKSLIP